ncbi:Acetylornithine deacetylase [termite gut metagenome]|uniref:Acetylornithine deacetylase n=1 Tax=termite gut metagenome TaxID=433724 RepID=A0A5J4R0J2_9ZZZZ
MEVVYLQRFIKTVSMLNFGIQTSIEVLNALIRIPSFSREEAAAADFLQNHIEIQGMTTGRKGNNIWCLSPMFDLQKPTILLNSHIDTIKPASGWKRDPFTPSQEEGKIYGLGSNDAGGSVVSLLHVFLHLCRTQQPYNLIYLASCEEEVSGQGGIESVLPCLPPITFAIVGEPTEMQPAIAEKGLMVIDVTAIGRAGHAARNEGDNAVYKALNDIAWFRDYRFEQESPLLGAVRMSVTQINAGTQHNVVPDRCTFVVDVRSNELYSNERLFAEIRQHIVCEAKARSFRLNSSRISVEHPFVQRAIRLGRKPFGSPTLSDQALMPFTSVKIGPGCSSRSHTADEYILVREMEEAVALYLQLLDQLILF